MQKCDFSNLACVVMASGLGKRFGSNKLLAELNGKPLLEYTLNALQAAGLQQILIVTRSHDLEQLAKRLDITVLLHQLPYQSDTVALGVQYWLRSNLTLKGLLFATGDQPLLKASTIKHLCHSFLQAYEVNPAAQIHRLAYREKQQLIPGNPVIFSQELFPELLKLPQDKGGAILCKKYPHIVHNLETNPQELIDIDTQEDLIKLERILQHENEL